MKYWRSTIIYVPQSIYLSDASILENIALGQKAKEIDKKRIKNAAKCAQIDNFIDNYPLRLYLTGDNLFTITKYNGIDPEITGGIDSNFYPRARTIAFGLDLNF